MTIFSPDGKYGYVCSSFTPETDVITVADHKIVGKVQQASRFCPNIAATPDSTQIWFTLKDTGKTQVFNAQPPFNLLKTLDTGPISNHVNIVRNANGMFAYVTVGGLNEVKVFRTDNFEQVATIPTGKLPHGIWPSGDGTRVYVGLENEDRIAAIDTLKNNVIATIPGGQAAQAVVYVPNAVPDGPGTEGLEPLSIAGKSEQLQLAPPGSKVGEKASTSVSLSDQGLVQVLEAAVTGLDPGMHYLLALSDEPSGTGTLEPLQGFMTNPAGSAIVNAIGPIRQAVRGEGKVRHRYLVIAPGTADAHGAVVQVEVE
jgi:YVTN family beta-propeller protein